MKSKLSSNLIIRLNDDLKRDIAHIQDASGCSISEVVRQCLVSFVDYYKENKCVILPVTCVPVREMKRKSK